MIYLYSDPDHLDVESHYETGSSSVQRCTHRVADEAVSRLVDDESEDGAIQNDGDEEHQHHSDLHTGRSTH